MKALAVIVLPAALLFGSCSWLNHMPDDPRPCTFTRDAEVCAAAWDVSDDALHSVYDGVALIQDARAAGNHVVLRRAVIWTRAAVAVARDAFEIIGRDAKPLDEAERVILAAIAYLSV